MRAHAGLTAGVARRGDRAHAFEEGQLFRRDRDRIPPKRRERNLRLQGRRRAPEAVVDLLKPPPVAHGRPDAVKPGALVGGSGRRERRARKLLGVEAVGALLGRVAADRQGARQRLGLEAVAEPREILNSRLLCGQAGSQVRTDVDVHRCLLKDREWQRAARHVCALIFSAAGLIRPYEASAPTRKMLQWLLVPRHSGYDWLAGWSSLAACF